MYELLVHHPNERRPRSRVVVSRAADVLDRIPELLAEHNTCERIEVMFNGIRLFAVDCAGNRIP